MAQHILRAGYDAPNGKEEFKFDLEALKPASAESKQAYLSALRTSTKQLQNDVNTFLTKKMEEDKQTARASEKSKQSNKLDEDEEEANYGEEKVDDD